MMGFSIVSFEALRRLLPWGFPKPQEFLITLLVILE